MTTPHHVLEPDGMPAAVGFSHGVASAPGRTVHVAGQIGAGPGGTIPPGFVDQFEVALANVVRVLDASSAEPLHVVSMTVYVTDLDAYRAARRSLGSVWRRHMGRHYPAMSLVGVAGLVEPGAVVEMSAVAVVPTA